ncbi:hypothetical protein BDF14DRAFT_1761862 [Spinellus fusiger]|nr:hypothetical protein BDF14DRAFT_1761862 [Spinellus fusiger]
METTWATFKTSPETVDLYTPQAVIAYVPTGMGAKGNTAIHQFYKSAEEWKINQVVHSTVKTTDRIIEEVEWTITLLTGKCTWLIPGLEPHQHVNKSVVLPAIISAVFEDNKIANVRFYWDQATVLRQLELIRHDQWPVCGKEQVDILRTPHLPPLHGLTLEEEKKKEPFKHDEQTMYMPGRIFGPVKPEDQVQRSIRSPHPIQPQRNIFTYEPPPTRPMVSHNPACLASSLKLSHDEGPNTPTPTRR